MTRLELPVPGALDEYAGRVRIAIVLGSGFNRVADGIASTASLPYVEIEGHPEPPAAAAGHVGELVLGEVEGMGVAVFRGRVHLYQGASALDAAWPARLAAALGAEALVLTNASGGLSTRLGVGDLVLVEDHINLTGANPLVGWPGPDGGNPFIGMRDAYDRRLGAIALEAAADEGVFLHPGVYAALQGPSYETPAEVAFLRGIGADVVGMSTVLEAIAARALGLRVLALSLVANAAGEADLSHEEVLAAVGRAEEPVTRLVLAILRRFAAG